MEPFEDTNNYYLLSTEMNAVTSTLSELEVACHKKTVRLVYNPIDHFGSSVFCEVFSANYFKIVVS